ncbi:cytochrome d ubiquinol oxidase subunit II, partial [Klebsiella pneumoniae]|nr:cytochrome d ubiquinol oxidase subunit II [Klebsiella pneumoniae]
GGSFDWATPFSFMCGIGVVIGYALLGSTWLIMKTDGSVAARARRTATLLLPVVIVFMGIVSLWTPIAIDRIAQRWFTVPNIFYLAPVPIITAAIAYYVWRGLKGTAEVSPFLG